MARKTRATEAAEAAAPAIAEPAAQRVTAVKAFDANFSCRGFAYRVGKTYKHNGPVRLCKSGFHVVTNPFDAWSYYPIIDNDGKLARYAEVECGGASDSGGDDSKTAWAELTIKAELKLPDFIRRAVDWVIEATRDKGDDPSGDGARIGSSGYGAQIGSSGDAARIGSSGYGAQIGSSGDAARIGSSGNGAQIGSSGDGAQIGSSGNGAQIGSSGDGAQIGSSGDGARIGSSGNGAQIGSSGNGAQIGSSGYGARIDASGEHAVIASAGRYSRARGKAGTWISLAEFDDDGKCIDFASGCVGQDGIEPDVWYFARGGKLVKAE